MQGLGVIGGSLLAALLLLNCGRSSTADSLDAASRGGAGGDANECAGGATNGGCNAAGGEPALEAYARVHTACNLNVRINRRGKVICVDLHIK